MTGSYLLYNELHYNVLMTDLGLIPHRTIYSLFMQAKVVSRVALLMPFLFYPLLAVSSSPPTLTDDTGNRTQGVQSHYQCAEHNSAKRQSEMLNPNRSLDRYSTIRN